MYAVVSILLDLNRLPYTTIIATEEDGQDTETFRWTICVPYGPSKINQAVVALVHLQSLQRDRPINPSREPAVAVNGGPIDVVVAGYKKSLVGGVLRAEHVKHNKDGQLVQMGREVSTSSLATNYYTVAEHIRCLLYTWRQPIETRSAAIREHFALAIRHSMLLRDQDLRAINFANITAETLTRRLGGKSFEMGAFFCPDRHWG